MKVTNVLIDKSGKQQAIWFPFSEPINNRNCNVNGDGGVIITFLDSDEFGNDTIYHLELDIQDIEVINKTKL